MPTYNPDGTIRLDTTNTVGAGGVGPHGISGGTSSFSADWFRENYSTLDGLAAKVAGSGVPPQRVQIEITETAARKIRTLMQKQGGKA